MSLVLGIFHDPNHTQGQNFRIQHGSDLCRVKSGAKLDPNRDAPTRTHRLPAVRSTRVYTTLLAPKFGDVERAATWSTRAVEARHDGREGGEPLVVQLVLEEKHPALQLDARALGERLVGRSRSEQVALRSALGRGGRGMVRGGFA